MSRYRTVSSCIGPNNSTFSRLHSNKRNCAQNEIEIKDENNRQNDTNRITTYFKDEKDRPKTI